MTLKTLLPPTLTSTTSTSASCSSVSVYSCGRLPGTSADGTVILEKTLDAGERFMLPATEQPPKLRTGNSGAVYFAVNGQTYGPAAPGAKVIKDVVLSPDALAQNYAVADVTADPELASMFAVASAAPLPGEGGQATP